MRFFKDEADVEAVLATPLAVVYKHSSTCWQSMVAMRQIKEFATEHPEAPVYTVDVLAQRPLSNLIAERLGVRHQSPQVIVVRGGVPVWADSHGGVKAANVADGLEQTQ